MENMEPNNYENTISTSKEKSIAKAIDVLLKELDSTPKVKIYRPNINFGRMAVCFIVWLSPILLTGVLIRYYELSHTCYRWTTVAVALISTVVFLKRIIIYLILLYQRFAPERIRSSCVFEPTCSNYMIKAIEKYGVLRGIIKGIKRLLRCHYPNCGIDYP